MNREIKFRALKDDMSNCNFVYGSLIYSELGNPRIQQDSKLMVFSSCIKGSEGQFTGLKDKNGVDIYEGDILKNRHGKNATVSFIDECSCGCCNYGSGYLWSKEEALYYEVIGNIHQNPELL